MTVEERWQKCLTAARVETSRGLQPKRLAVRYDAESLDEIEELLNRAKLELEINTDYGKLTLDETDKAAKRMGVSVQKVATDGGRPVADTEQPACTDITCDGKAEYAYWIPDLGDFSRVHEPERADLSDGDLCPYVCEACRDWRLSNGRYDADRFVDPREKLVADGGRDMSDPERPEQPEVVCLCGSTRFKETYREENERLTMEGKIVLSCGVFGHADGVSFSEGEKEMLDMLHKRKIDLADRIHVINVDGYIGDSTQAEIEYARGTDTEITYLEQPVATDGGQSTIGTERERVEEIREKLKDGDGEIAVRYDDKYGHQYWEWRSGEVVRLTQLNFEDEGDYNGPWATETHLLEDMVGDGDLEYVDREDTPFEQSVSAGDDR